MSFVVGIFFAICTVGFFASVGFNAILYSTLKHVREEKDELEEMLKEELRKNE